MRKRFGIDIGDSLTVFEVTEPYKIDSNEFLSKGRATPFEGMEVYGRCMLTAANGKIAWAEK